MEFQVNEKKGLNIPISISSSFIASIVAFDSLRGSVFCSILESFLCSASKEILHSTSEILLEGKLCEDSSNEDGTKDEVYTLVE